MIQQLDFGTGTPIRHELVEEVDHLPVYISTPGRCSSATMECSMFSDELTVSVHWHEYAEFIWLQGGHMTAVVQADTYELDPGDLLIINSGELHMTRIVERRFYCPYVLMQLSAQRMSEYFPGREGLRFTTLIRREELEQEIQVLEYAAQGGGDVSSAARLDEDILQSLVSLRAAAALGSFSRLEDQVVQLKSAVLRRDLTYGAGLTAEGLSARLQSLKSQLSELTRQTGSSTTRVTAPQPGIFSAAADGCEDITPQQLLTLDGAGLEQLISSADPHSQAASTGKLILGDTWYLAVPLSQKAGERLAHLSTVTVRFTGDFSQDVTMTVERVAAGQSGAVAVLSSDKYLSDTTLLRRQTVELIFSSTQGIRVPKSCLRMETEEKEIPDTSETEPVSRLGVYAIVNGRAVFKEVEVVSEGADFYVLRSVTTGKNALRAGDEIVLRGTGMFDGKVMEF